MSSTAVAPPRVFISDSHDSAEHRRRVLELSNRLREDGVDCHIDQYEVSPPEGWPRWMERRIQEADFVLIVCTEIYARRFVVRQRLQLPLGVPPLLRAWLPQQRRRGASCGGALGDDVRF